MGTEVAISFTSLRAQLENEKSSLFKIDENIKKIVQTTGRFNDRLAITITLTVFYHFVIILFISHVVVVDLIHQESIQEATTGQEAEMLFQTEGIILKTTINSQSENMKPKLCSAGIVGAVTDCNYSM